MGRSAENEIRVAKGLHGDVGTLLDESPLWRSASREFWALNTDIEVSEAPRTASKSSEESATTSSETTVSAKVLMRRGRWDEEEKVME